MNESFIPRFASTRVRRASGNAGLARALTVHDRRGHAACREVHRQSPAPPAPRLFACPRFSSRRQSRASCRPRTSRASARTSHPVPPGWNTFARKSALSPARSRLLPWLRLRQDITLRGARDIQRAVSHPFRGEGFSKWRGKILPAEGPSYQPGFTGAQVGGQIFFLVCAESSCYILPLSLPLPLCL